MQHSRVFSSKIRCGLFAAIVVGLAPATAIPDTVDLGGRTQHGRVTGITAGEVQIAEAEAIPRKRVEQLLFDAFRVVAKPQSIVLKDGTRLCGEFGLINSDTVHFHSVSLGSLSVPRSKVAGTLYNGQQEIPQDVRAPATGKATVIMHNGTERTGSLLAWTGAGVVLRGNDGLLKVPREQLQYVSLFEVDGSAPVTLRNGDRLAFDIEWQGASFLVTTEFAEKPVTLSIEALKEVKF